MTSTRFTDEELTYFDQVAHPFIESASRWRDWCPFKTIPHRRKTEWKVLEKINQAAATFDGSRTNLAASSFTWDEAELFWLGHHFQWSELEVETARETGNTISTDEIRLAYLKQAQQIERLIIQGNMAWEKPDVTGLLSGSTDCTVTATEYWATAGKPYAHIQVGYGVLTALGYEPPFTLLVGDRLRAGLAAEHTAGKGIPARDVIAESFEVDNLQYLPQTAYSATVVPTEHDLTVCPLPMPVSKDGAWMLMKADSNNFQVLEAFPPKLTLVPEMDVKSRTYYGRLDWFGTMKIVHADSVCDEDDVDLAA